MWIFIELLKVYLENNGIIRTKDIKMLFRQEEEVIKSEILYC